MAIVAATFWNNDVEDWIIAAGIALGVAVGILVGCIVARMIIARIMSRRESGVLAFARELLGKNTNIFALLVGIFFGSLVLDLPGEVDDVIRSAMAVVLLVWMGVWGNIAISFWTRRRQQKEGVARQELGALMALRFIARLALWAMLALVALQNIGVEVTALVAGLGISGIAIALAAQSVLADLFASFAILFDKPFVVGDFIIVDEYLGSVEHVGIKTTRLQSLSGEQIVFSNSDLLGSRIRNYKLMRERRIVFAFGVVYETSYEKLEAVPGMVREIVEAQDNVRLDRVHFKEYGDFSLNFEVVYYVLSPDYAVYMDAQQSINLAIFRRFEEEGIIFAYPTQTLYVNRQEPESIPVPAEAR